MTGPNGDDEAPQHLVIHYDATGDTAPEPVAEPGEPVPARPGLWARYRYWLTTPLIVAVLGSAAYAVGYVLYDPPSRLPAPDFSIQDPLYGANSISTDFLDSALEPFRYADLTVVPTGPVYRLELPRTVGDRLFGRREEVALIFVANTQAGDGARVLVLTGDGGPRVVAVHSPSPTHGRDPTGLFLALNLADFEQAPIVHAIEAAIPSLEELPSIEVSAEDYYVFGPYLRGDSEAVRRRVDDNPVMAHLAAALAAAESDVTLTPPAFLIAQAPARGTINAVYLPALRAVMEPLWGDGSTDSLAHELVHAYMHTVADDRLQTLQAAADYFEGAHPVLYGEVVGDLYERLGREGRAEEALAFLAGAVAAQQTKTVSTPRLLSNRGYLAISEPVLYSDIGLLAQIGLLPVCMQGSEGADGEITPDYYAEVAVACE